MKWFQHDSNASYDAKIKKLLIKHGAIGYAVYFHCIELIANDLTPSNITFELEHDAEIIADNLKIQGTQEESGIDIVNRIMLTIIELGLFTQSNGKIFCFKLAERLDNTISRNPEINKIKSLRSSNVVITNKLLPEENTIDKNTIDKNTIDKNTYGDLNNVYLSDKEYNRLIEDYGEKIILKYINSLSLYEKIDNYIDHNRTIRKWLNNDDISKRKNIEYIYKDVEVDPID